MTDDIFTQQELTAIIESCGKARGEKGFRESSKGSGRREQVETKTLNLSGVSEARNPLPPRVLGALQLAF